MNIQISVIIVNWNGMKWLEKCLSSLATQTFRSFEIIIVDNNSSDGSCDFIRKNFPQVRIVQNMTNLGFAKATNSGVNLAIGEYILLINNDTWIEPNFIERIFSFLTKNNIDVVAPCEAHYTGEKRNYYTSRIDPFGHALYSFGDTFKNVQPFYLTGVCLLFRKKLYLKSGGFDTDFFMYFEEVDWFWRLIMQKKKFAYINDLYIFHIGSASTGLGIKTSTFLWRNQNTLQMLLKNYSLPNLFWVLPFYMLQNILEIIFFLILFKPHIALTYVEGWLFNLRIINRTIVKRLEIQSKRKCSDWYIMKNYMYLGSAKLNNLVQYAKESLFS